MVLALAVVASALPVSAQLLWWGEYHGTGDLLREPSGQSWYFDQEVTAHLRFPVFRYRLGSLQFDTGLFLTAGSLAGRSDSALGLGRTGFTLSLFPYRKFPLSLYYSRSSRPSMFGAPEWSSSTLGARLMIRSVTTGTWWLHGEQSSMDRGGESEERRYFTVAQNRKFGKVSTDFSLRAEEWQAEAPLGWKRTTATYNASMPLPKEGFLLSATVFQKEEFTSFSTDRLEERLLWAQRFGEKWSFVADASWYDRSIEPWKEGGWSASSVLHRDSGAFRLFGGGAYGGSTSQSEGLEAQSSTSVQSFAGATWLGPKGWTLTADAAMGSSTQSGPVSESSTTQTVHLGVGKDESLPAWVSRLAFHFGDLSFEHRVQEIYPPNYFPPELELLRRDYYESTRSGRSQFHADLYHSQESGGRKADWLSGAGQLEFNHTLLLYTRADIRKESDPLTGGRNSQSLLVNGRYRSRTKPYTAGLSLAFGNYSSTAGEGMASGGGSGSTWSLGGSFSTLAFKMPWNLNLLMINTSAGGSSLQFSVNSQWDLRDLHLRWTYFYDRDPNGWYRHRVYFDLLRLFRGNAM